MYSLRCLLCTCLQAFLRGIVVHPVLRESEAIRIFLLQPGDLSRNPAWIILINPPPSYKQRAGM